MNDAEKLRESVMDVQYEVNRAVSDPQDQDRTADALLALRDAVMILAGEEARVKRPDPAARLAVERERFEAAVHIVAAELRCWWSFDERQQHTHSWHTREDFIERRLPELLAAALGLDP